MISSSAGRCIDVHGGQSTDGAPLMVWSCNGLARQKWTFVNHTIRGLGGKCMDVALSSHDSGAVIQLWNCNGSEAQHFHLTSSGDLRNYASNKCVDLKSLDKVNGIRLELWQCDGTASQKWSAS